MGAFIKKSFLSRPTRKTNIFIICCSQWSEVKLVAKSLALSSQYSGRQFVPFQQHEPNMENIYAHSPFFTVNAAWFGEAQDGCQQSCENSHTDQHAQHDGEGQWVLGFKTTLFERCKREGNRWVIVV